MNQKKTDRESPAGKLLFFEGNKTERENTVWESLSYAEKNRLLFLRQKNLLEMFLARGAISREQYEKSLHDLTAKMGAAAKQDGEG